MNKDTKDVFVKSLKTTLIQVVGVSVRLITSIFLGRILGASGLGDVNLINQIITILLVFSMFGMDHVLVKKISIAVEEKNYDVIGKSIFTALKTTFIAALILTLLLVLLSEKIAIFFDVNQIKIPLLVASVVIIPQTIGIVFAVSVNGFQKVWQSRFLKDFSTSIFVLFGLLFCYFSEIDINLLNVIIIYSVSKIVTFLLSAIYLKSQYSPLFIKSDIDNAMIKMAKPLLFVSATTLLMSSVDIIMLGWLSTSKDVGLYTVATRLVMFIAFFLQISNAALSSKLASFFKANRLQEIKVLVQQVTFALLIIGLFSVSIFVVFGANFLEFWGEEFKEAYLALLILCVGQFINISTGCSGILLIMSGNEKIFSSITGVFLIFNIILNYILIQFYGIIGAAIATSLTFGLENIVRVVVARKKTGILTIPIFYLKRN